MTTDPRGPAGRVLSRPVGILLVAGLLVGACSSDDAGSSAADTAATTAPPTAAVVTSSPTTTATPAPPATTTPPAPSTVTLPDGAALLQQSLDALAAGYGFVTRATVNGTVVLSSEGDQIGLASRRTVTSQGVTVELIVLPEGTWKGENGVWEELEEPAPAVDPLATLRAPTSVTVASHTPELTTLVATYPAAAFGVPGETIDVTIEVTGTTLRSFTYTAATAEGTAVSRTDVGPLADTTPVTSPAA